MSHTVRPPADAAIEITLPTVRFPFAWSAASARGQHRPVNQDAVRCRPDLALFALADGLGGHAAGELAARTALDAVDRRLRASSAADAVLRYATTPTLEGRRELCQVLADATLEAHRAVVATAAASEAQRGMGTTLDVVLLAGPSAFFAHVGDARAYIGRGELLVQLSDDHASYDALRTSGKRGDETGSRVPLAHALGDARPPRVDTYWVELTPGERILLCSDGVAPALGRQANVPPRLDRLDPTNGATELVRRAHTLDASDDASAILLTVGGVVGGATVERTSSREDATTLKHAALFADLTATARSSLLDAAVELDVPAGASLDRVVASDRAAYILLDGAISLPNGRVLGAPGLVFAESLLDVATRDPLPRVVERARVLRFRQCDFLAVCERDPKLSADVHRRLARHIATR